MKTNKNEPWSAILMRTLPRTFLYFIPCVFLTLTGCATSALMKEARGQVKSQDRLVVNSVTDAYRERDVVHICMNAYDLDSHRDYVMTLNLPLHMRNRMDVRLNPSNGGFEAVSGQVVLEASDNYVGFFPKPEDMTYGCSRAGKHIALYKLSQVVSPYDSYGSRAVPAFNLPSGVNEAVYVIGNKYQPTNFGYVSTTQIVDNTYTLDVKAKRMADMRSMKNTKHYLYIFTPITVTFDTAVVATEVAIESLVTSYLYAHREDSGENGSVTIYP